MRTKTLLLTAALSFAGIATSMAQVYSVNAVGYINLTMKPGFNMVANQLNRTPSNNLNTIFAGVPIESQVLKFSNGNYTADIYDGSQWIDAVQNTPSVTVANPGQGLFFFNPNTTDLGVTLVGEVPQGNGLSVSLPAGYSLVSSIVPQSIALTAANGFPQVLEMQYLTFNAATQSYDPSFINDGTGWIDINSQSVTPTPAVGQGFFIFNPEGTAKTWTRNFSVN